MRIRYNRTFGWAILALGVAGVLLEVLLRAIGTPGGPLLPALVCILFGVLYLTRTYFEVRPGEVTLRALIGPLRRRRRLEPGDALAVDDGRLVIVRAGGERRRLGIRRWMAHAEDWEAALAGVVRPGG